MSCLETQDITCLETQHLSGLETHDMSCLEREDMSCLETQEMGHPDDTHLWITPLTQKSMIFQKNLDMFGITLGVSGTCFGIVLASSWPCFGVEFSRIFHRPGTPLGATGHQNPGFLWKPIPERRVFPEPDFWSTFGGGVRGMSLVVPIFPSSGALGFAAETK